MDRNAQKNISEHKILEALLGSKLENVIPVPEDELLGLYSVLLMGPSEVSFLSKLLYGKNSSGSIQIVFFQGMGYGIGEAGAEEQELSILWLSW